MDYQVVVHYDCRTLILHHISEQGAIKEACKVLDNMLLSRVKWNSLEEYQHDLLEKIRECCLWNDFNGANSLWNKWREKYTQNHRAFAISINKSTQV